ncbi:unnamed protein product [Lasius platythorax]|uniref:Uncharacterized protein n=1 Tax=Lasius platythorax TaxID=488582 RepID=A0AAV2N9J2_9HYME
MAAFNGIRVLPDMPKNIPNMETLIQDFETGLGSSSRQDTVSSLPSSGGSFVKKIVEAYESSVRASIENAEQEHARKRPGLFNTIRNQKNVEKSDSSPSIYGELGSSLRRWSSLKNTSEISSGLSVVKKHDLEDDFVTPNRCHTKSDKKTDILKTWSEISSKINKYGFMRELTNIRPNSSKRKRETENLKRRGQVFYSPPESEGTYKSKNNMPLICSSPLEDVEDDTDYDEDPLDDILTNSRDSSSPSNNSYKNLQVNLYGFESEEWQFELSASSQSSKSSSRSLCDDTSSAKNHANDSLLLGSSFQDITVVPSKDVLNARENPQVTEQPESSADFNRESPRVIGVSLKRPIKIDNDTSVTWIPMLDENLPQKKSLKKLLSVFNRAKLSLSYRKIGKKLKRKQPKERHIFDSGFIERCPSVSSSSSQKSWHSDAGHVDDEPSTPPTFGTFGRPKCVSERCTEKTVKNRMMLTEILHHAPKVASDFVPSDPNSWISSRGTVSLGKEDRQDVEPSSRNTSIASFSKSRVFCRHPSLPKHPHLIRSSVPKHPFVAQTKMDQIEEEEATAERTMQCGEKIEEPDVLKLRYPSSLPIPVPQSAQNISYPRMSEYADLSTINNYDRPNSPKSISTLDEVVLRRQAAIYDVPRRSWLSNLTMDFLPPVYGDNPYDQIKPCASRFATVSPKNLRFSMSHEKSRAIEQSFDN